MAAIEVVDVRTDMRLQRFDGTDEKWGDWSLRFEAYTALLGFEEFMTAAGQRQDPLLNDQLDERLTMSGHIRGYYNQGRTCTHVPDVGGVVPMQVDAVRAQLPNGKANGKGKTYKSDKSGGKSGRYQKGKDSKTKSKGRDGGKHAKNQTEYFDGERGYCGKWGHKRADCRKKKADDRRRSQQPADGTVKAASGYFDGKPGGWVFAVTAQPNGRVAKVGGSILIDSGSDDHLCRHRFVPEAPISAAVDAPRLFDVQQRPLPTAGLRGVEMTLKEGITATADFLVADVSDDLLSMGKLLRQGFRFNLSLEDGLYMTKGHRSLQLTLERNSLRLPIVAAGPAAEAHHCRGAAERHKQAVKEQLGIQHDPVDARELPVPKVTLEDSERKAPLISFDFGFCKTADEDGYLTKVEDTYATMLVAFSSDAGVVKVTPCPSKSASPYAIAGIQHFAQRLETGKCRLRTDSEPATKAILDGVVAELTGKVIPELTPKHSSQSNPAEAAVKIAEGQTRALRSRRPRAAPPVATEIPRADQQQQQQQAERRGLPPEAEASESKRARVAAVHELDVGSIDDPPDAFWEEISDEVEDQTEDMFDVDAQVELDKKLTLEHLQSLLDHGVGEDTPKSEARGMKHITTCWEKQWRWKPARQEWQRKVRFVCRGFRWQEWRDDLFTPGSAPISNGLIDFMPLKRGFEAMALDATDAFYQAPEHEDVVVDPPQEYPDRLQTEGKSTDIYWKLKRQLPGRRTAAPGWVEHMAGILMGEMRMARCEMAPQFFYSSETGVVVELHMDDLHMAGPKGALEGFRDELGQHVTFSGGEIHEYGTTYEHLKRLRARFGHGTELKANPKCLDYVVETLNLGSANTAPTPGVPAHKALMGSTSALSPVQAGIYRSCVEAPTYYAQDRADCQYEVSLLGRMLSGPTDGAFTALKRLVRYLMGTRDAVNWLPRPTEGTNVELVGYGDSDWAGDLQTRRSQSSGKIEIDNVPIHSFRRRQAIAATSSGVAEYDAAIAVAEDLLYFKSLLEFMGFTVAATLLTDSSAARGIAKREGVGMVRSLEARVLWLQQAIKRKLMDLGTVGTDDNKADLGTKILGYERFVKLRRHLHGPATGYDGYYDTEVCSTDGVVASDWTSYWLVLVVWTLVVAIVFGYAGFRYASWGEQEWLLVQAEPDDAKDKKIDSGIGCMLSTSTKSTVDQSNRTRRTVGTQSQTTYKWRWATPRFQPLSISMHGAFLEVHAGSEAKARGLFLY
ncbi:unnamed protein product [Prorocentrum cordatum]|uniref:Copia protein n=1 Tax=Prorocentrum cordatum TaxID=2364126 RepID=A0ABN9VA57_9DINO|nr:unnamed protein product [Polarella glacialis]